MPKKTKKVKAKKVQSKKKVKKKKTTKKKAVKKKAKKGVVKKKKIVRKKTVKKKKTKTTKKVRKKVIKKKRKRKKKIVMDDVYKMLNKVQVEKKKITFAMFADDADTAENIIKDVNLKYDKAIMKTQTVFTIYPNKENELDILDIDYLEDEIPEEGQIFG